MAIVQGIVAPSGAVVRARGNFRVVSKNTTHLKIEVTGQRTDKAFVLATAWRADGDIGRSAVSASPDPRTTNVMVFAVESTYGLSFRIEP